MSCGFGGAVHQRLAGADAVALADATGACPSEIRYSFGSPTLGRDEHLALALGVLAEADTMPSISEMTACSFGLRASNSSATRGRPPVMSLVFVVSRGILRDDVAGLDRGRRR